MSDSIATATTDTSTTATSSIVTNYLWPLLYRGGQVVVAIFAVAAGLLYVQQESLLYFPSVAGLPRYNAQNPRGYRHPGERGLPDYTSHIITSAVDGVQIHAWYIRHKHAASTTTTGDSTPLPVIIFFHGNAGNIGLRLPNAVEFMRHVRANLLLVEYRGYGDSPGGASVKPTEIGLKRDAVAAWEFVRTELTTRAHGNNNNNNSSGTVPPIYVFGRSLGGAVAMHLAAHAEAQGMPLTGCILENTFTSISDMVDSVLPFLTPIKRFVLRIGWNSLQLLQQGHVRQTPLLLLAGDADTLVPHAHMQMLRNAAHLAGLSTVVWHVIAGGTHNETWMQGGRPYWQAMANFIASTTSSSSSSAAAATTVSMDGTTTTASSSSSIPIMSNQFMGMARDAWNNNNADSQTKKDKDT